jgi:hypothetical protein
MTPTISKLQSIVALALCPSAPQGEWEASAIAIIRICRTHKLNPFAISAPPRHEPDSPTLGFGKYRGRSVRWIVENDPSYVEWLLEKAKNIGPLMRDIFTKEMRATYGRR